MKLYEYVNEISAVLNTVNETGEMDPAVEQRLDELQADMKAKVANVCAFIREREAEAEAVRVEAARLTERKRAREREVERLKQYLKMQLGRLNVDRFEAELFTVTVVANSQPSVALVANVDVPKKYGKVTVTLDKAKVLADYNAGKKLPAGIIVETGDHVRIR